MARNVCPRRNGSVANGALGRSQKLLSKVASMLTSIYSYGQVAGVAHTIMTYVFEVSNPRWPLTSSAAPPYPPSTSQALPSAIVSIAAAPMPIWVLKTYRKVEQNCRLLGSYYQVQYWKVEITGYFNTTYQLEIRDAVGTTVGKSFAGSVVSIWAHMRSPDGRLARPSRAGLLCVRRNRRGARGTHGAPSLLRSARLRSALGWCAG